jgi:HIRAN domain-containing protein
MKPSLGFLLQDFDSNVMLIRVISGCLAFWFVLWFLRLIFSGPRRSQRRSPALHPLTLNSDFQHVKTIRTKVRGVSFSNDDDHHSRQKIIRDQCNDGDSLILMREPGKSHAIALYLQSGEKIGHVSRELAEELAPLLDSGQFVARAHILKVTGDWDGSEHLSVGVNFEIDLFKCLRDVPERLSA